MTRHSVPPRLETSRLVLRAFEQDDLEAHAAMCRDPEVMRHLGGTLDREQSWRNLALHLGHWLLRGYGNWALERKRDGVMIGRVGLWEPEGWPGLEIGWALAREAWGNGYATEAARAAVEWAWVTLGAPDLISVIRPGNETSIRVACRLGMQPRREQVVGGARVRIYGMDRPPAHSARR